LAAQHQLCRGLWNHVKTTRYGLWINKKHG
jgi:hypothetical protein